MMGQCAKIQRAPKRGVRRRFKGAARRHRTDAKTLSTAFPYRWGVVQPVGHRTVKPIPLFFNICEHQTVLQNQPVMQLPLVLVFVF